MEKFILKVLSAVILVSFVLSALVPANAFGYFAIEYEHKVIIVVGEVADVYGTTLSRFGDDYHDMTLAYDVKGEYVTVSGIFACDVKVSSFGFAYEGDDTAYVGSEKIIDEEIEFAEITGSTGEAVRFSVDVPVYIGEHTFYLVVVLEDDAIYEIARITYTGVENGTDLPKETTIGVYLWAITTNVGADSYFRVPAYVDEGYFIVDMTETIANIEKEYDREFGVVSVKINNKETEFDSYELLPKNQIIIYSSYDESYQILLTYEKAVEVNVDPNYEGSIGSAKVKAVHGSYGWIMEEPFVQRGKFIADWNEKPDGSGESYWDEGYIVFPESPYVNLGALTIYAIWADLGEPGDINSDGEVNNKDVVIIFKYLSGEKVKCDEFALDVNYDGYSDNKDVAALFRYVSGGDVNAYYAGYATKYVFQGFRFDLPGGFKTVASADEDTVTMIGCCGDIISASVVDMAEADFRALPDEAFERAITGNFDAGIISTQRLEKNGRDTVIVEYMLNNSDVCIARAAFTCKDGKMLTLLIYDISSCYIYELEDAAGSVR